MWLCPHSVFCNDCCSKSTLQDLSKTLTCNHFPHCPQTLSFFLFLSVQETWATSYASIGHPQIVACWYAVEYSGPQWVLSIEKKVPNVVWDEEKNHMSTGRDDLWRSQPHFPIVPFPWPQTDPKTQPNITVSHIA